METVVSGSYDGTIKLWRLGTGNYSVLFLGIHKEFGLSPSAPMGTLLVASRQDIKIWRLDTGNNSTISGHSDSVSRCDQLRWADPCQWQLG